jgi:ribosomal protein S18 acetylase RimI-like enzyme
MALWRVRATVDDRPGFLAVLTASLALRSINILAVQVHTTEVGAVDDFLVDAPDNMSEEDLLSAIERGRGRDAWVCRTDAYGLIDPPTHVLGLAGRLVADPDSLGSALSVLLGGCLVQREPQPTAEGYSATAMRLPDLTGGMIVLTRLAPAFTPAEYARAQALVEVARAASTRQLGSALLLLPDGSEVSVRPAGSEDVAAISAMHARCGSNSLYRRYLAGTRGPSNRQLARLLAPARGCSLVAEDASGAVIAWANLIGEGEVAEFALLVEDGSQRRGIGTALLRRMIALAGPSGFRAVTVHTHADNDAMLRTLRRLPQPARLDLDSGLVAVTLTVSPQPAAV